MEGSTRSSDHTRVDSDRSAAITSAAPPAGGHESTFSTLSEPDTLREYLSPILSKISQQFMQLPLDVVSEDEVAPNSSRPYHHTPIEPPTSSQPKGIRRDVSARARRVRPQPKPSSTSLVQSLDLSQVRQPLADGDLGSLGGSRPQSARSDVSIGSAGSAFTCFSESSSSQVTSPRHRTLSGTVSMPSLVRS